MQDDVGASTSTSSSSSSGGGSSQEPHQHPEQQYSNSSSLDDSSSSRSSNPLIAGADAELQVSKDIIEILRNRVRRWPPMHSIAQPLPPALRCP
jgi:hypothetical protein